LQTKCCAAAEVTQGYCAERSVVILLILAFRPDTVKEELRRCRRHIMKMRRENSSPSLGRANDFCCRAGILALAIVTAAFWAIAAQGQSSSSGTTSQTQSSTQTTPSQATAPADSGSKPATAAKTSGQANATTAKPKAKRVYTEDDMSSLHGHISVVGGGNSGGNSSDDENSDTGRSAGYTRSATSNDEARWRAMAQQI
jgi:cytoskeletal protein RodZ